MTSLTQITEFLDRFALPDLAEDWDNVGLLLGSSTSEVARILTCLTLTSDVAAEAIEKEVQCVISHHPILFRAVKRVTSETEEGQMLLDLIQAGVAVISPHTRYDSALYGINQQIAEALDLQNIAPIRPLRMDSQIDSTELSRLGSGRWGTLAASLSLEELNEKVKQALNLSQLQFVGDSQQQVQTVGIACGAAAEFLRDAQKLGCDAFITGEARFHSCLEARAMGIGMILPGHYATERHAMETLAGILNQEFPTLECFASEVETDPLLWG